jgi:ATP-dependent Lon protease
MSKHKKKEAHKPGHATDPPQSAGVPAIPAPPFEAGGQPPPIPKTLPILPLRDLVAFPGTVMPLTIGRPSTLRLLEESLPQSKIIGLFAQRDPEVNEPGGDDLHPIGTAALILKLIRQPNDTVTVITHGLGRIKLGKVLQTAPFLKAEVQTLSDVVHKDKGHEAAFKTLRETAVELISISPNIPDQIEGVVANIQDAGHLADFLAANLEANVQQKQDLLEELDLAKRVRAVQLLMSKQVDIARLQQKIHQDVQSTITDTQRKAYLREQMKAIQRELGEGEDSATAQLAELRRKVKEAAPPEAVLSEAERELKRLESIHPASPEYSVILTYLEIIADLPWNKLSDDKVDLTKARQVLDRDHYDLDKVKRRLIEFLAVRKLNPTGRGPILCLVGPPGVGKTSLGQSIADALGRKFVRMSFGGIRDEAEIRGHRRTYIGAMPGRLIQEMRRAGTRNPVMMLDEVDKIGADFRGDPASALLEVLDPRQNHAFVDRYLDVPFDLSQVIFIATANYMDPVPAPLRDRMEIIEIPGYTDLQKLEIARRYLAPRQLKENGLTSKRIVIKNAALMKIIDAYTREAGVRDLEREIGAVCRSIAALVATNKVRKAVTVDAKRVEQILGPEQHVRELASRVATPGVVTGLAYTPVGGEVLFIEATQYPGKGSLKLTGQIGNVMKESAEAALSLIKSRAKRLGLDEKLFNEIDLHVHVPAGAVPKDGPSAGIAMFTAMASLLMNRPCRADVAMTGEVTLRGLVLPIGGLKEKTLAALRAGITTVICPKGNRKDMPDVTDEVKRKIDFVFADDVETVLETALQPLAKVKAKHNGQAAVHNGKHAAHKPAAPTGAPA